MDHPSLSIYYATTNGYQLRPPSSPGLDTVRHVNCRRENIHHTYLDGTRSTGKAIFKDNLAWPQQPTTNPTPRRLWKKYIQSSFIRYQYKWKTSMTTILPLSYFTTNDDRTNQPNILPPTCLHTNTAHHESIAEHIKTVPNWHRRLVASHSREANDLEIWRSFRSKKQITIAPDEGLAKQAGTFGWIMVNSANIVLFKGSGPVDGPIETNSSTRSELGGYTAPFLLVTLLARHWGLKHKCKFTWVVDSTAAISQVTFATNPAHANKKYPYNVDYLSTIKALHKELKRPISAKWVKAHQDDSKQHANLSRHAILNIEADRLATQHRLRHHIRPKHKTEYLQPTKY